MDISQDNILKKTYLSFSRFIYLHEFESKNMSNGNQDDGSFDTHEEIALIRTLLQHNNSNNRPRKHIETICLTNRQIKRVNTCS